MVIRFNDCVIDREKLTIMVGHRIRQFHRIKGNRSYSKHDNIFFETIAHLILNGWTRKQDLYDFLFADDPDGGPLAGLNTLDIRFHQWRPYLDKIDLKIVREKRSGIMWYKVASESSHV